MVRLESVSAAEVMSTAATNLIHAHFAISNPVGADSATRTQPESHRTAAPQISRFAFSMKTVEPRAISVIPKHRSAKMDAHTNALASQTTTLPARHIASDVPPTTSVQMDSNVYVA